MTGIETTTTLLGAAARTQYDLLVARAFEDDATGGVYGYRRMNMSLGPVLDLISDPADERLKDPKAHFELVIVDSGNSSGDAWKLVYHPLIGSATMFLETGLL